MVNSLYKKTNVIAGTFAGSESFSVVNAGIHSHSGGAGAVPVMDFEGKVATLAAPLCLPNVLTCRLATSLCLANVQHVGRLHLCGCEDAEAGQHGL